MSHFSVGVIIPLDREKDIEDYIEEVMLPYSENLDVDPYDHECYCKNRAGQMAANAAVEAVWGKDFQYWELSAEDKNKFDQLQKDARMNTPKEPWPECDDCGGTGIYESVSNPDGEWDWYRIGGRWDGCLPSTVGVPSTDGGFNFDDVHEQLGNNVCLTQQLVAFKNEEGGQGYLFFAFIDLKGKWHEKGDMGWWAVVTDEKDASIWRQECMGYYKDHPDHKVVMVDAHV